MILVGANLVAGSSYSSIKVYNCTVGLPAASHLELSIRQVSAQQAATILKALKDGYQVAAVAGWQSNPRVAPYSNGQLNISYTDRRSVLRANSHQAVYELGASVLAKLEQLCRR